MAVEIAPKPPDRVGRENPNASLLVQIKKHRRLNTGADFLLDVDFSLPAGITILFGPSGAGKSTVLDCVAGWLKPDDGRIVASQRVFFDRRATLDLPPNHRNVGYVFQDLALFPHLTTEANIEYGLARHSSRKRKELSAAISQSLGISHLRTRVPGQISGGEKQRVALARALVINPCVLLLDEPLAGLDAATKSAILDDLRAWNAEHRVPILYVSHSREEVFALGEQVVFIENGKVIVQGTPYSVLEAPSHETIAQSADFENIFDATVVARHESQGTMTCRLSGASVGLEVPLSRVQPGAQVRVAIRAGDILLANVRPAGLSARNVIPGRLLSLQQKDVLVVARVDCGAVFDVHLTPAACNDLQVAVEKTVWLVVKTHSCHLLWRG